MEETLSASRSRLAIQEGAIGSSQYGQYHKVSTTTALPFDEAVRAESEQLSEEICLLLLAWQIACNVGVLKNLRIVTTLENSTKKHK